MDNSNYKTKDNYVSYIQYSFVFCPRYKRKIFNINGVKTKFYELIKEECKELDIEIKGIRFWPDGVYIVLNCPPTLSPANIIQNIKAYTGKKLIESFYELSKMQNLWTRNCLISTSNNIDATIIKQYIESQKNRY